jgi:hypothetical protein
VVLRRGLERREVFPANRQQHPARGHAQRGGGFLHISDDNPVVARNGLPFGPTHHAQGYAGLGTCGFRISAYLGCEGMRRIDHRIDALGMQPSSQPCRTPEAAYPDRQFLWRGLPRPPGQRQHRVEPCISGQRVAKLRRFSCAAQDQHPHAWILAP